MFSSIWSKRGSGGGDSSSASESHQPLFFTVPSIVGEEDLEESISLHGGRVVYSEYEDDGEEAEPDEEFWNELSGRPSSSKQAPADIYLDIPTMHSARRSRDSLSEGLLPSNAIPPALTSNVGLRKYKDVPFAGLYLFLLLIMFLTGVILFFTTTSSRLEGYTHGAVFLAINGCAGSIAFSIVFTFVAAVVWIYFMRSCVKVLVWSTLTVVPVVTAIMFIWVIRASSTGKLRDSGDPDPQDDSLRILSLAPLGICAIYASLLYWQKRRVEKAVTVIELASEILRDNPEMLKVSLLILGAYIAFSVIWLIFFSRLFLVGHMIFNNGDGIWVMDTSAHLLIGFFLFMYLWTSAVLGNIQRHEPENFKEQSPTQIALSHALTTSFGTVCFGGLILSSVQALAYITRFLKKKLKGKLNPIFYCIYIFMQCLDGVVDSINNYSIVYVGIFGMSFCSAALEATKIFRRNLITGLKTGLITKMILYIGSVILALTCGFATFIFATHSLESPYGYVSGIIASLIPFYISQFITSIMMNTIDATFFCYAIDLDVNMNHCNKAHEAFS
ncbi:9374_t:CDS:10 [Paraglomus occultum]|uniref:Protein PNS1 n=1 Tax=Paraglomus occultum TaxID=144539 RepID=A0A9N9ASC7_9GLOM|nr:9374_t:CDS:10 [Paraglomus occultum]